MGMADSRRNAQEVHEAVVRNLESRTSFRLALEGSELARALAMGRLRAETPDASTRELVARFLQQSFRPEDLPPTLR